MAGESTERMKLACRWLGIRPAGGLKPPVQPSRRGWASPACEPGTLTLVSGPSGCGKTRLLRQLRTATPRRWVVLHRLCLPNLRVVDLHADQPLEPWLEDLCRVGLADWTVWRLRPGQLSDGQRFRLRLAEAIRIARANPRAAPRSPGVIVCDEFAATLDRVAAIAVSRTLRRCIDRDRQIAAIVATSHDDLVRALQPDVWVRPGETDHAR